MKLLYLSILMTAFVLNAGAQITVGSLAAPDKNVLLDLKSNPDNSSAKGVLPPRVKLSSTASISPMAAPVVAGTTVYNTETTGDVTPGYYYWDGSKWVKLAIEKETARPQYFYMPPIVLPIDGSDNTLYDSYDSGTRTFRVNLYNRYAAQMNAGNLNKNPGAANPLPVYNASQLEFYITYFDSSVFSTASVDNAGILTYTLKPAPLPLSEKTYMNIILEVKP